MDRQALNQTDAKYEIDDYPDATDFLAREVIDVPLVQPIGFVWKPRIRVKAGTRKHEDRE